MDSGERVGCSTGGPFVDSEPEEAGSCDGTRLVDDIPLIEEVAE